MSVPGTRQRGSVAVEAAIGVPALVTMVMLLVLAGRVYLAHQSVEAAAGAAARAASLARAHGQASQDATAAAAAILADRDLHCRRTSVSIDPEAYRSRRNPRAIAMVTCELDVTGLGAGAGTRTIRAQFTSPLDVYRGR